MRNIAILTSIIIYLCVSAQAQLNVSVYRNDNQFNNFRLKEGDFVTHSYENDQLSLKFTDFISGLTTVPIESIDSLVIHAVDIPVLYFTLPDYPDASMLWEKDLYLKTDLSIKGNGFTEDQDNLTLQIKGRGNTTWDMPKKPMRLKFSKKTSICGFKKAKSFVLLNNYVDPTMMKNTLALWLAKRLGIPYSNTTVPCHVFINDKYAGAYVLTQKIGINSGSVDIDEKQGMLFEISTEYDELYKFRSKIWNLPVMVKDPDFDELYEDDPEGLNPEERLNLWEEDFNYAEQMISDGKAAEVVDIESAVNYILVYNLMLHGDIGFPKSMYMHKKTLGKDDKYYLGPAWDFDVASNLKVPVGDEIVQWSPSLKLYFPNILKNISKCDEFQIRYKERMEEFQNEILPEFFDFFDEYAALIESSAKLNGMRWPENFLYPEWLYVESSFNSKENVANLRDWLTKRFEYLKNEQLNN